MKIKGNKKMGIKSCLLLSGTFFYRFKPSTFDYFKIFILYAHFKAKCMAINKNYDIIEIDKNKWNINEDKLCF